MRTVTQGNNNPAAQKDLTKQLMVSLIRDADSSPDSRVSEGQSTLTQVQRWHPLTGLQGNPQ